VYEHARDGDWVYVRLPDGREGRVRAARYGSFIERGSVRRADMDDARTVLHEAMRRSTWQWVGLIVLALAVLVALLIVSLLGGY
jgi:hypothetical protein